MRASTRQKKLKTIFKTIATLRSDFSIFVSRMTPELRNFASFRRIVFFLFKSSVLSFSKSLRFFMFQVLEVYEQVWLLLRSIIDHRLLRRIIKKRSYIFWDKRAVRTVIEITERCVLFLVEFYATVRKLERYDCRFHVVTMYFVQQRTSKTVFYNRRLVTTGTFHASNHPVSDNSTRVWGILLWYTVGWNIYLCYIPM